MSEARQDTLTMAENQLVSPQLPGVAGLGQRLETTKFGQVLAGGAQALGEDVRSLGEWGVGQFGQMIRTPYDVAAGQYPLSEIPAVAQREAGQLATFGLGAGRLVPPPPGSLGIFAGTEADVRTWPRGPSGRIMPLIHAEDLETLGRNPDEVFDRTGWFRGADNQWRFTISDEGAKLREENLKPPPDPYAWMPPDLRSRVEDALPTNPDHLAVGYDTYKHLNDVLDHPDLYDAYPWLKDVPVRQTSVPDINSGVRGSFNSTRGITLTPATPGDMLSTLLHEVQHAVQHREGFARGGNVEEFLPPTFDHDYLNSLEELQRHEDLLGNAGYNPAAFRRSFMLGHDMGSGIEGGVASKLGANFLEDYRSAIRNHQGLLGARNQAFQNYLSLAGEVEARAVQEQLAQGRWMEPPWKMEGYIPHEEQIVRPWAGRSLEQEAFTPNHQLVPVEHDPWGEIPK